MTSERTTIPDNGLAADLRTAPQIHREDSVQDAIIEDQYAHLVKTVQNYNPAADFIHIESAYHFAKRCHEGQRRKSGEPYIIHPLAVAQIVAEELKLDSESIEAALLHDCIEDTAATYEDIARLFSPTVADLVEGVSKSDGSTCSGRTDTFKLVNFSCGEEKIGQIVDVRITEAKTFSLFGELV